MQRTETRGGGPVAASRRSILPLDLFGLPLTASEEAAAAYRDGQRKLLRVEVGAVGDFERAVLLDERFAVARVAVSLLASELGSGRHLEVGIGAASAAAAGATRRERGHVDAVAAWCRDGARTATPRLVAHLDEYPRDAVILSVLLPTIAFTGAGDALPDAWGLLERFAPEYGNDAWCIGLLAFARQEQDRFAEAADLAADALDRDPAGGHAVHALAHANYELDRHPEGLGWLDEWLARFGSRQLYPTHFAWHAAIHELAIGDWAAALDRYQRSIAPPRAVAMRALVDAGSLVWRFQLRGVDPGRQLVPPITREVGDLLDQPPTAFTYLHSALVRAAAGDADGLRWLRMRGSLGLTPAEESVAQLVADGLVELLEQRYARAGESLWSALPHLRLLGGSAAQREVVEDSCLFALAMAARMDRVQVLLRRRLARRPAQRDRAALDSAVTEPTAESVLAALYQAPITAPQPSPLGQEEDGP